MCTRLTIIGTVHTGNISVSNHVIPSSSYLCSHGTLQDGQEASVLPAGWNSSQELYTMNYQCGGHKYIVKGLAMDDQLLVNVLVTVLCSGIDSIYSMYLVSHSQTTFFFCWCDGGKTKEKKSCLAMQDYYVPCSVNACCF